MELERQILHKNREVGRAFSQMTLDDDYNLPDFKPDLTKVIKERGKIHLDEIHVNNGHVWFKGVMEFDILYRTDLDNRKINSLNGEISFQESLSIDGTEELDPVKVEGRIEDISVSVINSRKLSIRSLVEFTAVAEKPEEAVVLTGIGEQAECEVETEQMNVLELMTDKKDTFRIRKEIALSSNKPNMDEILWRSVELRGLSSHLRNGEIEVSGEALIYVFYAGIEEEERLQWFETTVPVQGSVECNICEEALVHRIDANLAQVNLEIQPDEDGEERNIMLEMVINLSICLWNEEQIEMISDIYALDRQVNPAFQTVYFEKLLVKNEAKCRIADKIELDAEQEDILQICSNEEKLTVEQTTVTDEGVLVEGTLTVEILYMTPDEAMPVGAKRAYIPFSQVIEMPKAENPVKIHLDGGIEQVTTVLTDSRTIDVKAVISLNLLAFEQQERQTITDIEETELDLAALQQRPGIVGYIAREGDRLFGIAKENHTTVENLMETNHLTGPFVKPGEKLLIIKTVG
ncbi:MAG: DUF3794 domain-containing protein [Eubacterium sp.]|nr:DUF3794 domain-containing protein [Eubacterium sp.]